MEAGRRNHSNDVRCGDPVSDIPSGPERQHLSERVSKQCTTTNQHVITNKKPQLQRPFIGATDFAGDKRLGVDFRALWVGRATAAIFCDRHVGDSFQRTREAHTTHNTPTRTNDSSPSHPHYQPEAATPTSSRWCCGFGQKLRTCWRDSVPAACGDGRALTEESSPKKSNRHEREHPDQETAAPTAIRWCYGCRSKVFSSWKRLVPDSTMVQHVPVVMPSCFFTTKHSSGARKYQLLPHFPGTMHSNGFRCGVW